MAVSRCASKSLARIGGPEGMQGVADGKMARRVARHAPGWLQEAFAMASSTIGPWPRPGTPLLVSFQDGNAPAGSGSCFLSNIDVTEETLGTLGSPAHGLAAAETGG